MPIAVEAILPLVRTMPSRFGAEAHKRLQELEQQFIDELGSFLFAYNSSLQDAKVTLDRPSEQVLELLTTKSQFNRTSFVKHVSIQVLVHLDMDAYRNANPGKELEQKVLEHFAAYEVSEALAAALQISELAVPGGVNVLMGVAIANGNWVWIDQKSAFYFLQVPERDEPQWPQIKSYEMGAVLSWAQELGFGRSAFGESRIARAFASYTHVIGLGRSREGEILFRSMQGLEAFYCDGNGDLRRQLAEKVKVWLGPWEGSKNIVGHLYDSRSKFVHGSAAVEFFRPYGDPWAENEKLKSESSYAKQFAVRLLCSTLQKCVENRTKNLSWGFTVEARS